MIDRPPDPPPAAVEELRSTLGDRLITLPERSIEEYIPEPVYIRVGRTKSEVIARLQELRARNTYAELLAFKKVLSQQLADRLLSDDLTGLSHITAAVQRANR